MIVAEVGDGVALVDTVNVALVEPAGMVTDDGGVATAALLLESEMAAPPEGAATVSVTVPVEEAPPGTLAGLKLREARGDAPVLRLK